MRSRARPLLDPVRVRRFGALLAALAFAAPVLAAWRLSDAAWIQFLTLGVVALAARRPWDGLLIVAGLAPVIGVFGAALGVPLSLRELLIVAVFAGWVIRGAIDPPRTALLPPDLRWPVLTAAVLVVVSLVVELQGHRALAGAEAFEATIRHTLGFGLFRDRHGVRGLNASLTYLEGLAMFAAAVALTRRWPDAVGQAVTMAVAGAAGAALLNIQRLIVAAQSAAVPLERLRELLGSVRVNVSYGDVNAAGSYFALLVFPAGWLTLRGRTWWRRAVPATALFAILAAAWLTGSRAAVAAILLVAVAAAAAIARTHARRRLILAGAIAACVAAAGTFVTLAPHRVFDANLPIALQIRLHMAWISVRMLANEPLFGVGVGGYAEASQPLLASSPIAAHYARENAHNQLLQWLGELGLVGTGTLLWLLSAAVRRVWRHRAGADRPVVMGLAAGLAAFAVTALLGHPLLIPEVNHAFWLLLGLACGAASGADAPSATRGRFAAVAVIGLACVLLPWRFDRELSSLPLEHVRHGVSPWHVDADGLRYQTFTRQVTLFVPADGRAVDIPLQLGDDGTPAVLEIRFRNRVADRITLTGDAWQTYRLIVGRTRNDPPYLRLEIRLLDKDERPVRIGRTMVR